MSQVFHSFAQTLGWLLYSAPSIASLRSFPILIPQFTPCHLPSPAVPATTGKLSPLAFAVALSSRSLQLIPSPLSCFWSNITSSMITLFKITNCPSAYSFPYSPFSFSIAHIHHLVTLYNIYYTCCLFSLFSSLFYPKCPEQWRAYSRCLIFVTWKSHTIVLMTKLVYAKPLAQYRHTKSLSKYYLLFLQWLLLL